MTQTTTGNTPSFLTSDSIRQACALGSLDAHCEAVFLALAENIRADPERLRQAQDLHSATYGDAELRSDQIDAVQPLFGAQSDTLYMLIGLDSIHIARAKQSARGVPSEISDLICDHLAINVKRYARTHPGQVGCEDWNMWWWRAIGRGNLYRLGRLEFVPQKFEGHIMVFKHRHTGQVQTLLTQTARLGPDGYFDEKNGQPPAFTMQGDSIAGCPVTPDGRATFMPVQLDLRNWRRVLAPGDIVLDFHIPPLEPLRPELVRDAITRALAFFPTYYPEHKIAAITCDSWIFSPHLSELMPPESNLVAVQREGHLFPVPSSDEWAFYFVFGSRKIDINTVEQETRLQRAIADRVKRGQPVRVGGWFFLPQDLPRFGTQPYRTQGA